MAETEKYNSTKRFGARYGRKLKERFGKIEAMQRKKQKCPYCSAPKVKRIAAGIWNCRKCGVKFAGKAYSVDKKTIVKLLDSKNPKGLGNSENFQSKTKPETVEEPVAIEEKKEEVN